MENTAYPSFKGYKDRDNNHGNLFLFYLYQIKSVHSKRDHHLLFFVYLLIAI